MKNFVIVSAITLAACGSGNAASGQSHAPQSAPKLDVAGVRPGMSAADARTALERAGWRVESFPGMDWAAKVDQEASRQGRDFHSDEPRRGVETLQAHKGEENLLVKLEPVPSGPTVVSVKYDAPMAGRTVENVRGQMLKRYGTPDKQTRAGAPLSMTWCSGGERCRMVYGAAKPALQVEEDAYHKLNILVLEGADAERARRAALQKAIGGVIKPQSSF